MYRCLFFGLQIGNRHSKYRSIARHRCTRVDFNGSTTSYHNDPPEFREKAKIIAEIYVRKHFEGQVHALATRKFHRAIEVTGTAVIQHIMSAVFRDNAS